MVFDLFYVQGVSEQRERDPAWDTDVLPNEVAKLVALVLLSKALAFQPTNTEVEESWKKFLLAFCFR